MVRMAKVGHDKLLRMVVLFRSSGADNHTRLCERYPTSSAVANRKQGRKQMKEAELYPILANWMKKHFRCFKAAGPVGTRYSRADVVGIRDNGGGNSGEVELIVIEVKRGTEPFATASGQAAGYSVYANRVYLADVREQGFTVEEREIASNLGVGLIQVGRRKPQEVLSSREHRPITRMWLEMARKLNFYPCRICGTFIEIEAGYKNLAKGNYSESDH
jgi:hypothetical protein